MKRIWIAAAIVFGFATAANAATLSIVTDKLTYNVGETIVLTVAATTSGEAPTPNVVAEVSYTNSLVSAICASGNADCEAAPIPAFTSFGGGGTWSAGGLQGNCDSGPNLKCRAFDQIAFNSATAVDDGSWNSVFNFSANASGVVNFDFNPAQFFGIGGPAPGSFVAGSTVTIGGGVIPEPTTGALLGLGLLSLAAGGRRRA